MQLDQSKVSSDLRHSICLQLSSTSPMGYKTNKEDYIKCSGKYGDYNHSVLDIFCLVKSKNHILTHNVIYMLARKKQNTILRSAQN